MNDYQRFLESKAEAHVPAGFTVDAAALHPLLKDFQRDIVVWALRLGRAAIFAERGLGKTFMQVEWARHVVARSSGRVLIVCPLAVAHQTIAEAARLGVVVTYVRSQAEVDAAPSRYVIANYDMAIKGVFDPAAFAGVVLDESSKLKTFTSKTREYLVEAFAQTPYRLACTATPSPNDTLELGNHAEFLGVMTSGEMMTRWFMRDSNDANNLRLKSHAVADFWRWVTSWAVCLTRPSDLNPNYSDAGYDLPPLEIRHEPVAVDHSRAWARPDEDGQARLLLDGNQSAVAMWAEKRETLAARAQRVAAIVAREPGEHWIIWHDTDYERDAIAAAVPGATVVTGSQTPEEKEQLLASFTEGGVRIMATKPRIGGWGLNWQHCARMIFMGVTHKFEEFYQALGRCHRFGQTRPVVAHVVFAESEAGIVETVKVKWKRHEAMHREMVAAMGESGLVADLRHRTAAMSAEVETATAAGARWQVHLGDAVRVMPGLAADSIHLSVSSWPFSDQYMYSASLADMGNCDGDDEFFAQMDFLIPELLRVTIPGRLALVHAKDRIVYGTKNNGYFRIQRFSDNCCAAMEKHGWLFYGRITIATDPVRENNQTDRLGHGNLKKDASRLGVGMPEYLLLFRKPHTKTAKGGTWSDAPIDSLTEANGYSLPRWQIDANSLWRSSGDRLRLPWEAEGYDYHAHVAYLEELDRKHQLGKSNGLPIPTDHPFVWHDIQRTAVLNHRMARDGKDERHICPLQLDVCERAIVRWSNPGDTVLDYFMGIGSVGVVALQQRRRAIGIELKRSYYDAAVRYLTETEQAEGRVDLFTWAQQREEQGA